VEGEKVEEEEEADEGDAAGDDGVNVGLRSSLAAGVPPSSADFGLADVPADGLSADDLSAGDLPTVSAGSGTELSGRSAEALSVLAAGSLAGVPSAPGRSPAPERELPVLAREDDMVPLSTTASTDSPSGSTSGPDGAVMTGACAIRPASSTPSSSVLTGAPLCRS
jgi:hypothetical protein